MPELDHWMDRLTVAAQSLVGAFGDLRTRGYDKEPDISAAALDDIEQLVRDLRANGFGAEGSVPNGRAVLIEEANLYADHTCTCPYCLHAEPAGPGDASALTLTIDPKELTRG